MDVRQLRYMVAVAEELHFGRAARRLHISQAPLSTTIQRLERELGHKLFDRTTRRVSLTAEGAELFRRATQILGQMGEIPSAVDRVAMGLAGTLRVGYVSSASYSILPQAVRRLRERAPDVDLHLVPASTAEQVDMLREGRLDVGIIRGYPAVADLDVRLIYEEELVACLPEDHPLATNDRVSAADLSPEPLIFFRARDMSGFVTEFNQVFAGHKFPRVHTHVVHQETALGFVAAGVGFTLLPASVSTFLPAAVRVIRLSEPSSTTTHRAFPRISRTPATHIFDEALTESAHAHQRSIKQPG